MTTTIKTEAPEVVTFDEIAPARTRGAIGYVWGALRLLMGWTFLWAFLDKAFALGFSTGRNVETGAIDFFAKGQAWFNGGSPTEGVFAYALKGPFKGMYESIGGVHMTQAGPVATGNGWIDVVYMVAMLLIGLGLLLGIGTRLAAIGGAVWMVLFFTATAIWPEHNPFVDEHVVEFVVLIGLAIYAGAAQYLGLGRWWQNTNLVKKHPVLA
jgi:thiosulfate dehydrogenase [quinone] large subunit